MYLQVTDIIAVTIALTLSITLIATTAVRNAQLIAERNYWKQELQELKLVTDPSIWKD